MAWSDGLLCICIQCNPSALDLINLIADSYCSPKTHYRNDERSNLNGIRWKRIGENSTDVITGSFVGYGRPARVFFVRLCLVELTIPSSGNLFGAPSVSNFHPDLSAQKKRTPPLIRSGAPTSILLSQTGPDFGFALFLGVHPLLGLWE